MPRNVVALHPSKGPHHHVLCGLPMHLHFLREWWYGGRKSGSELFVEFLGWRRKMEGGLLGRVKGKFLPRPELQPDELIQCLSIEL